ncbi:hypothetical protein HY213_02085 [Candidatus Peregrinibacteria bacterium]|nr:hypothetical protein [Candidatus Peregrinibacteria bacterium]
MQNPFTTPAITKGFRAFFTRENLHALLTKEHAKLLVKKAWAWIMNISYVFSMMFLTGLAFFSPEHTALDSVFDGSRVLAIFFVCSLWYMTLQLPRERRDSHDDDWLS